MCGICGIINLDPTHRVNFKMLKMMCNEIYYRGPDADGYFVEENVGLGMRRLSIIDLQGGFQPIYNEDKSICIVFNGEIYNFRQLRSELIKIGHRFYTNSDTEVIIHLYEEFGENCVKRLRGMFAFAIWDNNKKQLFIARDRLGIKPLYYSITSGSFLFSSELKCILSTSMVHKEIDLTALSDFFSFLYVPAPRTIFKNIFKLMPAHYLVLKNHNLIINKYWTLEFEWNKRKDLNEYINEFYELFEESVKLRMISDVPLGAFLSGGIDSSLVVGVMSKISNKPVETFSIGYQQGGEYYDERKYAKIVSSLFNTQHHEFILKFEDINNLIKTIFIHFDEPIADSSALPNYLISRETRKFVTVALSGLGGDELSAGYERYLGIKFAKLYQRIPNILRKEIIPNIINALPDSRKGVHFYNRLKRFVNNANSPFLELYFNIIAEFNTMEKQQLFTPEVLKEITRPSEEIFREHCPQYMDDSNLLEKMLYIDLKTYLVDDLLTITDRMSMAHSLEARVPFLDHKLVEFFASIPGDLKLNGFTKKFILKKAAERLLPKTVIYRRKMGFSVPLVVWMRKELKEYIKKTIFEDPIKNMDFFNYTYIRKISEEHFSSKANHEEKLWALISFITWYKNYF